MPDEDVRVDTLGQQFVELAPEFRYSGTQHRRVERDVDPGDEDEGSFATEFGSTTLYFGFEVLEAAHGARDRILRAEQIEVDHLEELADRLPDLPDE